MSIQANAEFLIEMSESVMVLSRYP
jgi:hypothetical protein